MGSFFGLWQSARARRVRGGRSLPVRARPPFLERLEDRINFSTYLVTNTADSGAGSFRQAILDANGHPGPDIIDFNIGDGGLQTIAPTRALPAITDPVVIDGTSQPGYVGQPLIELTGAMLTGTTPVDGLQITAGNSTVEGLDIHSFSKSGMILTTNGVNKIMANFIGTDPTGQQALGNRGWGIYVGGPGDTIGGDQPGQGNLISGNGGTGLLIDQGGSGTRVQGNRIGTDLSGTRALPNGTSLSLMTRSAGYGINIFGSGNTIGGDQPGQGNLISGNGSSSPQQTGGSDGIEINGRGSNNRILGNYIGTDITGTRALPNLRWGVGVSGYANTIGGLTPGAANVISGNHSDGVDLLANLNVLEGNFIGTDPTGTSAVPNGGNGVNVAGGSTNTIGGPTPGAGNVISGNTKNGIAVTAGTGTLVQGNLIGTDSTGAAPLGNSMNGVLLQGSNNTIGGTTAGAGNIIGFNTLDGVQVMGNIQQGIPIGIQNGLQHNSIKGDGGLGIELTAGPPPAGQQPQFGNNGQAYPELDTVASNGVTTTVQGSLTSGPYNTYTLEFYANDTPNASGYGEGQYYLDSATVRTDAHGYVAFTVTLNAGAADGQCVAATATDYLSNTSQLSLCVPVNGSDSPSLTVPRGVVLAAQPVGSVAPLTLMSASATGVPETGSVGGTAQTDPVGNAQPVGANGGANPSAPAAPQLLESAGGQPAAELEVPLGADLTA